MSKSGPSLVLAALLLAGTMSAAPLSVALAEQSPPQKGAPTAPDGCWALRYYFGLWLAEVHWNDNSDDEDGFILEWKGPGDYGTRTLPANFVVAWSVPSGKNIKYRVRAFNASGLSAWSNWAVAPSGGGPG